MRAAYLRIISTFFTLIFVFVLSAIGLWGCGQKETPVQPKEEVKVSPVPSVNIVGTYPEDGGALLDLDHPIYVEFSDTVKPEGFSFSITPNPGQWKVSWKKRGKMVVLNHAARFSPGTEYELTLSPAKDGDQTKIKFMVYGPSSLKLIQTGLDSGALDADTAWTYRMQSLFEPDKLPEAYQSKTPPGDADALIRDYMNARSKVKPGIVRALDRYLKRPDDPESFFYKAYTAPAHSSKFLQFGPRAAWADDPLYPRPEDDTPARITSDTAPIRIWAPNNMIAKLFDVKNKIDTSYKRGLIYDSFKQLLGRGVQRDTGDSPNGGGPRLDIYILPPDMIVADALCRPCPGYASEQYDKNSNPKPRRRPAYIFINGSLSGKKLASTLAHELFHAFQYNFDAGEDHWWMEATAKWAEDYIEQSWDLEHNSIPQAFDRERNALRSLPIVDTQHEYGIYLYPYYLSNEYGDDIIAEIWKQCETTSSLKALDGAVPDGLDESLKRFALPTMDYGKYKGKIRKPDENDMGLYSHHGFKEIWVDTPDKSFSETIQIPPLGVAYVLVVIYVENPDSTPLARFDLKSFTLNEDLTVQAVFEPKGEARWEDWTGMEKKELCLDKDDSKFKEIAILVTNNNRDQTAIVNGDLDPDNEWPTAEIEIELDAEGCKEAEGTAIVTATLKENTHTKWEERSPRGDVQKTQTNLEGGGTATIRLSFEKKDSSYDAQTKTVTQFYDITDSTVQSFTTHGRSYYYHYNYDKDADCACTQKIIKKPSLQNYDVESSGGMSVTFDAKTMKAKYVALPALVVYYDMKEQRDTSYEGCCGSEGDKHTTSMKHIPFVVGSVKSKDSEQLAKEIKPEIDQMKKIALDSQKLADEIKEKMSELQGMDEKQADEFYKNLEKRIEEFSDQHNIEQMTQNFAKKVIPEDLKVTSGDGKHSIGGGGQRTDKKQIENGTSSREYDLKWRITLKEKPAAEK